MNTHEQQARNVAGLVGPSLMAIVTTELPFVQPHLYDQQTVTGVYLSGVLLFIAGLAIIRVHHRLARWTVLITVTGWGALLLGLVRMFAASSYRNASTDVGSMGWLLLEGLLILVGAVMTWHAYRPTR